MEAIWTYVTSRPVDEGWLAWLIPTVIQALALLVSLLLAQAFLMYFDRKVWAAVQMRKGPNVVGPFGLLQSFADLFKFVFKEIMVPAGANKVVFILAPVITFVLALVGWAVIPVGPGMVGADINVGILYLFGGFWNWNFIPLFPMFVVFFISALAETNRPPFDLPEAESELVAGYQVEYSSTLFLLFMIGELANIVLMCAMLTILFFGGWHSPIPWAPLETVPVFWFCLKVLFFFFLFAMVKAIVPRYRYDQLMRIGWKVFLPLSLVWVVLVSGVLLMLPGAVEYFQSWRG